MSVTRSVVVLLLLIARVASAQPVAIAIPVPAPKQIATAPRQPRGMAGIDVGLAFGQVRAEGVTDGWLARLDYELLPVLSPAGRVGAYLGFRTGFELWGAGDDNWGVALPFTIDVGVRAPGLRAGLMVGFDAFVLDQVEDDTGFGLYAPLAGVRAVFEHAGWSLGADARVVRRWQFGADDRTQWQLGAVASWLWEAPVHQPIR